MYQNKIICALSSLALIFFCIAYRDSLPSIYIVECLILLKTSVYISFRRNNVTFNELCESKDTLSSHEKAALIDKSFGIKRFFKFKLYLIVALNILILLYLVINAYEPSLIDQYLTEYPQYLSIIKSHMNGLQLFQNTIFNCVFILISFPYLSSEFRTYSSVNWKYFKFISQISFPYKYLQLIEAILLVIASYMKYTISAYILNLFGFLFLYEISIQSPLFFQTLHHSFKIKILSYLQSLLHYILIILFGLEYSGLPQYGLNSFSSMLSNNKQDYDALYLTILGISYILSVIVDLFYKIRKIRGQILIASQFTKKELYDELINKQMIRDKVRERRQSIFIVNKPEINTQQIIYNEFESNSDDIDINDEKKINYFVIMRTLIAIQQLYCIFIIMRFPYLGFTLSILWLFQSSITRNPLTIVYQICLVYFPTFYYLIRECEQLKVVDQILIWIQLILSLSILKFFTQFKIQIIENITERQIIRNEQINDEQNKINIAQLIWAFILRNSYSVTLIIVFWISLFTANIIHTLLLILTILFIVRHDTNKQNNNNQSFRHRHWIWMVILINIIIFLKYIYMLEIIEFGDLGNNIIEFFGLQFEYNLPFNLGFKDKDFGSLSIFWMLDVFVVLQYETYKSNTYQILQTQYQNLISQTKVFSQFGFIYSLLYSKFIIWICYWTAFLILIFQSFNLINLSQLLILLYIILIHVNFLISKDINYQKLQFYWSILLNLVGCMTLFRYLFDFSCLQLLQNKLKQITIYNFFFTYQEIIGLSKRVPVLIFPNLVLDLAVLCLGYIGQDYLQQMQNFNRENIKYSKNQSQQQNNNLIKEIELQDLNKSQLEQPLINEEISERASYIVNFQYDLIEQFPFLKTLLNIFGQILPLIIYIFVIITSISYKISCSMLIYLLIMFHYIYQTRQYFRDQFSVHKISMKLNESINYTYKNLLEIIRWRHIFIVKVEKEGTSVRITDQEDQRKKNTSLIQQINIIMKDIQQRSYLSKRKCEKIAIGFSILFILMTYLSQVLQHLENIIPQQTMINIKYILFAFGTYNDYQRQDKIYHDIYPYFFALILIIIEIKTTQKQQEIEDNLQQQRKTVSNNNISENKPFILRKSIEQESNYLIENFYYNKYQLLKLNFQQGAIHSSERMYMMILFFLAAISEGIFSIVYIVLFALVYYSSQNNKSIINFVSIVVVVVQYICYLVTLSQESSPRILPQDFENNEYIIFNFTNTEILDQLGLSGKGKSKIIFIFNCIIIFAIWLFYHFQEILSLKIILFIDQCYINMKNKIKEDHISSKFYIIVKRMYIIGIVYFPLFTHLSVLFYYLFINYEYNLIKAINLGMFLFTIFYLFLYEIHFTTPKIYQQSRIDIEKNFIVIQQFAIISIFTILFTKKLVDKSSYLSISELLIFYLLQLGKDLLDSNQYKEITKDFYYNIGTRSEAVGLAMSYEANNRKLSKLIERYKDRNNLKEKVDAITQMIHQYNQDNQNRPSDTNWDQTNVYQQNNPMSESLTLTIYKWIESHRNRFLFEPSFQIIHFIACQNLEILQIAEHEIDQIQNFEFLVEYLENFYKEATKFISPNYSKEQFLIKFHQQNQFDTNKINEIKNIKKDWQQLKEKIAEKAEQSDLKKEDITNDIYNKINWKRFILILGQFIITFWHFICFILLVIYYFLNHGFFTIMLMLLVFAYGAMEEQQPDKLMWIISYIYLNFLCTLEKLDDIIPFLKTNSFVIFLFGENSVLFQFITICAIIIQVNIMKNIGIYNKLITEFETVYGSILRYLFNGNNKLEDGIKRGKTKVSIVRSRSQEKFICINTAVQAQRISISMNQRFQALQKIEDDLIDYLTRIKLIKPSFFYRAFSSMKPGKDIYPFMAGCQIIIAIYIFLFYDQMKSMDSPSISELLKYSQFSGHMVIALLFQIFCILIDRYILQYKPKKREKNMIDIFFQDGKKGRNHQNFNNIIQQLNNNKSDFLNEEIKIIQTEMIQSAPIMKQSKEKQIQQQFYRKARSHSQIYQIEQSQIEQVALRYKYYFQMFLLLLVNLYLLYQVRQSTCNINGECQYITTNIFMILFYMLICLYFFLSAIQIKYGINDQIAQNTLMKGYKFHNFVIFKIYKLMPFLFELRTICDWAFAETSLTLFQWIKLEDIHSTLYLAKCNSYYFSTKKVGQKIPFHTKFSLGFLVIIVLLVLLFGPIFLYSPLNPTFQNDNLIGANIEVGLKINKTNYFTLFLNSHVSDIHQINEVEWSAKNLSQYKFLDNIDKDSLQIVKLTHFSDTYWDISYPSLYSLTENLKNVIDKKSNSTFNFIQTYRFIRQYTDQTQQYISDNYELNLTILQQFYESIVNCQINHSIIKPIKLDKFYHDFIRIDKNKDITVLDENLMNSVNIQLNCTQNDQFWWSIYSDYDHSIGMKFYIVSDKYSSALLGYSILGFYITIVYVAGKMARGIMSGGIDLIMLQDMPYPDNLLKICEAIIMARIEKDLIQEELLYFQLIDVIRSPQLMRNISGSFLQQRLLRLQLDKQKVQN